VRYAAAAHPPPIAVSHEGRPFWLDEGRSPPVGRYAPTVARSSGTFTLASGDLLFFYSDGLIERRREPITVGFDRLERLIVRCAQLDVGEICDHVIAHLTLGQAHDDDVVAMCVRFQP
jgi:serine phosphatase RsbU (regulator of sigma subunit)